MYYYKIVIPYLNIEDVVTSYSLIAYNPRTKKLYGCGHESKAQYVLYDDSFYRVRWMEEEPAELAGTLPEAELYAISKEEYDKIKIKSKKS